MPRPDVHYDWQEVSPAAEPAVGPGIAQRTRVLLGLFAALVVVVFLRAVQLEVSDGEALRAAAVQPRAQRVSLPAARGRILARDGTELARDENIACLAVSYRWLQQPADPLWLRATARSRAARQRRRDRQAIAAESEMLLAERSELHHRLARLCNLTDAEWLSRTGAIQQKVTRIAAGVNGRRLEKFNAEQAALRQPNKADAGETRGWLASAGDVLTILFSPARDLPPPPVTLAEELDYHVVFQDLSPQAIAELEEHADRYPGVRIVEQTRRAYPGGSLAAHVVGHVGAAPAVEAVRQENKESADRVGLLGIERGCEKTLQGAAGAEVRWFDRRGTMLKSETPAKPRAGQDVRLTLDPALQRTAESLLDSACSRLRPPSRVLSVGGAAIVLDVNNGNVLAIASAPRFDPNVLSGGGDDAEQALGDRRHPLFDRATRMEIPPGSVFKPLVAIALVESRAVASQQRFFCQGYLDNPDKDRCYIYRHFGVGHGDITLADALAQSCNVYFFHHAARMGPAPLVDWARRFEFGQTTGIDLPGESTGNLPTPRDLRRQKQREWTAADTRALSIGQGQLTVTPLQIVRMMAAIANGGRLVRPRLISSNESPDSRLANSPASVGQETGTPIADLSPATLKAVRDGLERAVADSSGTAYETVRLQSVKIAGKTGSAQAGPGREDHAWFAGYAPADNPRVALVVVLEHGGGGAAAAGPLARQLVLRMHQLGYFEPPTVGKGALAGKPPVAPEENVGVAGP